MADGNAPEGPARYTRPDTIADLEADARVLLEARAILVDRWQSGKHDEAAGELRQAASDLASRARHPSRQPTLLGEIQARMPGEGLPG